MVKILAIFFTKTAFRAHIDFDEKRKFLVEKCFKNRKKYLP
jgi:hypothetical protein